MRHAILSFALLLAALSAAPSAAANPLCENAAPLASNPTPYYPQVGYAPAGGSAWFRHLAHGDAQYQVAALVASQQNVDLYVYDAACGVLLCASANGLHRDDRCSVGGGEDYRVEVRDATGKGTPFTIYAFGARSPDPALVQNGDGTCSLERRPGGETLATLPCAPPEPPADTDGDGVPDLAEAELCARQSDATALDGTCAAGDWSAPTQDQVLAEAETALCAVEDDALASDGSCSGGDYAPPTPEAVAAEVLGLLPPPPPDTDGDGAPDDAEAILCAHQRPETVADGTCSGSDYAAPNPDDVVAEVTGLLP